MEAMKLSFGVMLGFLQQAIKEAKDPRKAAIANSKFDGSKILIP